MIQQYKDFEQSRVNNKSLISLLVKFKTAQRHLHEHRWGEVTPEYLSFSVSSGHSLMKALVLGV